MLLLCRPHQWLKNGFVVLGYVFSRQWSTDLGLLAAWLFVAFCLISSAVYVFNDLVDVERDRRHPAKRMRAIARGDVTQRQGVVLATILLAAALGIGGHVGSRALACLVGYLLLNIAYSLWLKHQAVVDVFAISGSFMLRILAGSWGLGIKPSGWMMICAFMLTLFLGFSKRRGELALSDGQTRPVLADYSTGMLDQFTVLTAACTVLCYAIYTLSIDTVLAHGGRSLAPTVPIVAFGVLRYLALLHTRPALAEDVARAVLKDRLLAACLAAWLAVSLLLLT